MAEYNTRIKHKRDTSANWTAKDPVLLDGEIIIVETANGGVRKKVGDGTKKYSQLPFDDEAIYNTLAAKSTGTVVGCCAALAEGDAAKRTDIFFLEPLPLFLH